MDWSIWKRSGEWREASGDFGACAVVAAVLAGSAALGCGPQVPYEAVVEDSEAAAEGMSDEELRAAWIGTYTVGYSPSNVAGQQHVQYEFRADGTAVKRAVRCSGIFEPLAEATWRVGEGGRIEVFASYEGQLSYAFVPGDFPCGVHDFYDPPDAAEPVAAVAGSYCPVQEHDDLSEACEMAACDEGAERCLEVFRE